MSPLPKLAAPSLQVKLCAFARDLNMAAMADSQAKTSQWRVIPLLFPVQRKILNALEVKSQRILLPFHPKLTTIGHCQESSSCKKK